MKGAVCIQLSRSKMFLIFGDGSFLLQIVNPYDSMVTLV